jgi:penicillin-binding protein 1C
VRHRASLPPLARGCAADSLEASEPIRIEGIADNSAIARAPNSDKPAAVRLRVLGAGGNVLWLVNGRLEGETHGAQPFEHAFAQAGEQAITALAASGAYAQLHIQVLR